jgi:nucleoside-diphosphate-sugar epimerase
MRTSPDALRDKRADRSSRILVTGGTGFLGSHIAMALLRAGYRVTLLARSSRTLPARDRIARLTDWFGLDGEARRRLDVAEGDILDARWAEAALGDTTGLGQTDEIVHCASNTSFAERKRPELEAVNIGGLRNTLDFAARSRCSFFHHISTAFVAGKRTGLCREEWVESGEFTNVYEETKARGEILARDVCRREGIRLTVYRPSIVYGDSLTGRTLRFNAVYFPVKAAVLLRGIYEADIRERGGAKAAAMGVRIEPDGSVFMPIRIEVEPRGGLNLVPVDYCVEAFMALREDGLDGGIFHIVNPRPKRIEDIIEYAERFFHLRGIEGCGAKAFADRPRNSLETLYDSYLEAYRPYMQDPRIFEVHHSGPVLERRGLACPEFDRDMFNRCMSFAVEAGWGTRLFPV